MINEIREMITDQMEFTNCAIKELEPEIKHKQRELDQLKQDQKAHIQFFKEMQEYAGRGFTGKPGPLLNNAIQNRVNTLYSRLERVKHDLDSSKRTVSLNQKEVDRLHGELLDYESSNSTIE